MEYGVKPLSTLLAYFSNCTRSNLLIRTLTKLRRNKTALDIDNVVDMSPPLVKEGSSGVANSTSWSSISIKHTNGEYTMIDLVVVQSMSRKIIPSTL